MSSSLQAKSLLSMLCKAQSSFLQQGVLMILLLLRTSLQFQKIAFQNCQQLIAKIVWQITLLYIEIDYFAIR